MSTELEQMTAAGGTLKLGGRTLLLRQLTLNDYGQIQAWLKARLPKPFAVLAAALKDLEPMREFDPEGYKEIREKMLIKAQEVQSQADGIGANPEMIDQALNSVDGVAFVLWLCQRKAQPDVTYEQILAWLGDTDLSNIKKLIDNVTMFNGPEDEDAPPGKRKAPAAT